jgi:aquaporin Z
MRRVGTVHDLGVSFVVLLQYPTSPIHQAFPDPALRRVLIGIALGMTAIGIIYSPLGQRSGAHFNPAVTLTFFRLGKVEFWDRPFMALRTSSVGCWGW